MRELNEKDKLWKKGEKIALSHLKSKKHNIIELNFSCKFGEIDIISEDGEFLVFTEVKTRTAVDYHHPLEAVNKAKMKKIIRVAKYYTVVNHLMNRSCRFDVIGIVLDEGIKFTIDHIEGAFVEEGRNFH